MLFAREPVGSFFFICGFCDRCRAPRRTPSYSAVACSSMSARMTANPCRKLFFSIHSSRV